MGERGRRDIYKLFYDDHETASVSSSEFNNVPPTSSQRVDRILGRHPSEYNRNDYDSNDYNSKDCNSKDCNSNDWKSNEQGLVYNRSDNALAIAPVLNPEIIRYDDETVEESTNRYYGYEDAERLDRFTNDLPANKDHPREIFCADDILRVARSKRQLDPRSGAVNINDGSNYRDRNRNHAVASPMPKAAVIRKKDQRDLDLKSEAAFPRLDGLKDRLLRGRLFNSRKTSDIELEVVYCNANDVKDDDRDRTADSSDDDSAGHAEADNEEGYESQLTDIENWRQFDNDDSVKFGDIFRYIQENGKISILLLILSVIAVALLITLIVVVNKR